MGTNRRVVGFNVVGFNVVGFNVVGSNVVGSNVIECPEATHVGVAARGAEPGQRLFRVAGPVQAEGDRRRAAR